MPFIYQGFYCHRGLVSWFVNVIQFCIEWFFGFGFVNLFVHNNTLETGAFSLIERRGLIILADLHNLPCSGGFGALFVYELLHNL